MRKLPSKAKLEKLPTWAILPPRKEREPTRALTTEPKKFKNLPPSLPLPPHAWSKLSWMKVNKENVKKIVKQHLNQLILEEDSK
jgi:hypothetical protein